jgi:predicted PurR-regulated permease PerM
MSDPQRAMMRIVVLALILASAATLAPFFASLVLAAWVADLLQPVVRGLRRALGGRRRAASAIVVLLVVAALAPLLAAVAAVVVAGGDLLGQLRTAFEGRGGLAGILLGDDVTSHPTFHQWADLASRYGTNAWRALNAIARTSASAVVAAVVFVAALYAFTASGPQSYRWFARHSPLPRESSARFARAFLETGRGLIVGGVGTALVQGVVATVAYVAIGVPRALLLGPLTAVCAIVPVVGTGIVWVPLAIGLGLAGDLVRGGAVVVVGVGVHSLIDNFVRPVLTRYGRLALPTVVVLVSMLGGISAFGAPGALLGPLIVRLALEALAIARTSRLFS